MDERTFAGPEQGPPQPAPALRLIGTTLALVTGGCSALMGLFMVAIAIFGQMGLGRTGAGLTGGALVLLSAPLFALPFSRPAAKKLLLLVLAVLGAFVGWLCFWPQGTATPSPLVKMAVVAFAVLLALRVYLAWKKHA